MKKQRRVEKETTQNGISSQKEILFFFFWTNKRDIFSSPLNVHAWIEGEKSAHSHSMSISFSLSSFDIYVEREGWGQMMATPFMLAASTSLLVIETYTARLISTIISMQV